MQGVGMIADIKVMRKEHIEMFGAVPNVIKMNIYHYTEIIAQLDPHISNIQNTVREVFGMKVEVISGIEHIEMGNE